MNTLNDNTVHPEDSNNMLYWTRKWNISLRELSDAILNTGSVRVSELNTYLRSRMGEQSLWYSLRNRFRLIQ
jgi:hypothetical protein